MGVSMWRLALRGKGAIPAARDAAVACGRYLGDPIHNFASAAAAIQSDPHRRLAQPQGLQIAAGLSWEKVGGENEEVSVAEVDVKLLLADVAKISKQIIHFNVRVDVPQRS